MLKLFRFLLPVLALCLLGATACAQDVGDSTQQAFTEGARDFVIFMWFACYLAAYSLVLPITLSFLQLFRGFETELAYWVLSLWAGGMGIDYLVARICNHHHQFFAALLALPLLFGWTVLVSTRRFADLTLDNAIRVGVVLALVCAPWKGPSFTPAPQKQTSPDSARPAVT